MIVTYINKMKNARPNRRALTKGETSNRDRILEAATDLFHEKGYGGLSISAICKRVGIAPTSLYWHFGDKAGLMRAIIENTSTGYTDQLQQSILAADGDINQQLSLLVDGVKSLVMAQPAGTLSFVSMLAQGATQDEDLNAAMAAARRRELTLISNEFKRALGEERGQTATLILLSFVNYAALVYRVTKSEEDVDEIIDALRHALSSQLPKG